VVQRRVVLGNAATIWERRQQSASSPRGFGGARLRIGALSPSVKLLDLHQLKQFAARWETLSCAVEVVLWPRTMACAKQASDRPAAALLPVRRRQRARDPRTGGRRSAVAGVWARTETPIRDRRTRRQPVHRRAAPNHHGSKERRPERTLPLILERTTAGCSSLRRATTASG
jgi:hypothetical protein